MIVKVTRKDIRHGEPDSTDSCPIALALRRMSFEWCQVQNSYWSYYNNRNRAPLPKKAKEFIKAFDQEKPVSPFSFRTVNLKKAV